MVIDKKNKNNIPEKFEMYRNSTIAVENNVLISKKYGFSGEKSTKMAVLISDLFRKNITLKDLIPEIKKIFSFDDNKSKLLALDIAGLRLLVVKDWIVGVEEYISSLGGNPDDYKESVEKEIAAVVKEKEEWEEEQKEIKKYEAELLAEAIPKIENIEDDKNEKVNFDLGQEIRDCEEIFNSKVLDFLSATSAYLVETANNVLLEILSDEKGFAYRDQFFRSLLANEEIVTTAPFILEKRKSSGTIGNWLKDFIEEKGSGIFDNIVLSDFLLKSSNAKKLNDEDRQLVKKVLLLYRNLKFFPESMPNDTGEGWQIIPFEEETESGDLIEAKARLEKEKEIINQPAADRAKKVAELKSQADLYDSKSLERKVIEEELKKLE